jgi:hypothetical protein
MSSSSVTTTTTTNSEVGTVLANVTKNPFNLFSSRAINMTDSQDFTNQFMIQVSLISLIITIVTYLVAGLIIVASNWRLVKTISANIKMNEHCCKCCCCYRCCASSVTTSSETADGCCRKYLTSALISIFIPIGTIFFGVIRWLPVIIALTYFLGAAFFRPLNVRCTSAQATGLGLSQGILLMYYSMGRGFVKTLFLFPQHIVAQSAYRVSKQASMFNTESIMDLYWSIGRKRGSGEGTSYYVNNHSLNENIVTENRRREKKRK